MVVGAVAGEWWALVPLGVTAAVSLGGGLAIRYLCRTSSSDGLRSPMGAVVVAVGWIGAAMLGGLPLYIAAVGSGEPSMAPYGTVWSAFFEGMSALTSSGLTMASDPSELPFAFQWWRTALEWVGGMGVVMLALILFRTHANRVSLVTSEINVEEFAEDNTDAVKRLWMVYSVLTGASVIAFWLVGMPLWEALNHGVAGVATGGFAVTSDSFGSYGSVVKWVGIVVMVLGAMDFAVHVRVFTRRQWSDLWRDSQTVGLWIALVLGSVVLLGVTTARGDTGSTTDFAFMWASALATCGFGTVDLADWSGAALWVLTVGMFVGAAAGSTGGGLKIRRVALLLKEIVWQIRDKDDVRKRRNQFEGEALETDEAFSLVRQASSLAMAFIASLAIGALALLVVLDGEFDTIDVLFETTSALGAVGLSSGVTSADLPAAAKAVMITLMWLGRLEVMAALMIVAALLDKVLGRGEPDERVLEDAGVSGA
ncbi:TrkH family potassium uptake protein [Rubrivirga sp.]|uniref:TrkH family potassium uptake protein n=1 Tax=Rubrivirga sp. TaxID=1885344 RepID=UPI003C77CB16